jgi:hypothetical protein
VYIISALIRRKDPDKELIRFTAVVSFALVAAFGIGFTVFFLRATSSSRDQPDRRCIWKLPETPDEWREKVSPVIKFPRLSPKAGRLFQKAESFSKSRLLPKKPSHFQNAGAGFLAPKIAK